MIFRFRRHFLFLVLISHAAAADGNLEIKPLAPGVWLHTSWQTVSTWGLVPSNGLIVREANHVVVIDTAWGAAPSLALLAWIDREPSLGGQALWVCFGPASFRFELPSSCLALSA